jgi:RNAse (barnase) inhibitor barstar
VGDSDLPSDVVETFDALYDLVVTQDPLEQAFVDRLNQANEALTDRIEQEVRRVTQAQLERRRLIQERRRSANEGREGDEA